MPRNELHVTRRVSAFIWTSRSADANGAATARTTDCCTQRSEPREVGTSVRAEAGHSEVGTAGASGEQSELLWLRCCKIFDIICCEYRR